MFLDGRNGSLPAEASYDLVVIGAGPAGIALAHELRASGLRIALLESGGREFDPDTQALYAAEHEGNEATDLTGGRLRYLGGTSNHWGGHCLPLDRIDLERGPLNGASGWPIDYEDLLAVYPRAHAHCDLGPFDYDHEGFLDIPDALLLLEGDADIRTVAFRQSPPTRFGRKYGDRLGSEEGPDVWLWTNAVDLLSDADGRVRTVATRTLDGLERRFSAETVVLACGAVEAARLLLYTNERNGRQFGSRGGLLGRCYMDHPSGGAAFLHFAAPVGDKVYWMPEAFAHEGVPVRFLLRLSDAALRREELANCHFFVIPFEASEAAQRLKREANTGLASLKTIGKWALDYDENPTFSLSDEYCSVINNADAFVMHHADRLLGEAGVARALLKYEAEQQPERSNGIALAETRDALGMPTIRLHWAPSEDDLESVRRTAMLVGAAAGRAGLGRLRLEDHGDEPYWGSVTAWHQLGTTRMAAAESDGVVDPDCRVFGTRNLYVASGGVMPSSGRANPTLTIVALAVRLADHLKGRMAR